MSIIAKFNPYQMSEEMVLAVTTGREELMESVLKTLKANQKSDSIAQHLLIRGPRGMGKSFFLKNLQIRFSKEKAFNNCDFLLLPEEQSNAQTPTEFLKLVQAQLNKKNGAESISMWEEPSELWQQELEVFKDFLKEEKSKAPDYHLVVVLENLNEFLANIQSEKKMRKTNESRIRYLMEKVPGFTLIAATPRIDNQGIDDDYNGRLFHAFKRCNLKPWEEAEYFDYYEKRKKLFEANLKIEFTEEQSRLKRTKLRAISKFTGGSPRIAVVLTNLLLEDDLVSTANTLFGLIDDLTPYYQDLNKEIPPKSRKLFDALIRNGENLSQSELAKLVGATQSQISRAFAWLTDNGYVVGEKRKGAPSYRYWVADRIHVLFYQMREINHNSNASPLWLLSDILVNFYQSDKLHLLIQSHFSDIESKSLIENFRKLKQMISSEEYDLSNVSPDLYTLAVELRRSQRKAHAPS